MAFRSLIRTVLTARPGYACSDCLARALGLPHAQIAMAALGLRNAEGFEVADETCGACHKRRHVVRLADVVVRKPAAKAGADVSPGAGAAVLPLGAAR